MRRGIAQKAKKHIQSALNAEESVKRERHMQRAKDIIAFPISYNIQRRSFGVHTSHDLELNVMGKYTGLDSEDDKWKATITESNKSNKTLQITIEGELHSDVYTFHLRKANPHIEGISFKMILAKGERNKNLPNELVVKNPQYHPHFTIKIDENEIGFWKLSQQSWQQQALQQELPPLSSEEDSSDTDRDQKRKTPESSESLNPQPKRKKVHITYESPHTFAIDLEGSKLVELNKLHEVLRNVSSDNDRPPKCYYTFSEENKDWKQKLIGVMHGDVYALVAHKYKREGFLEKIMEFQPLFKHIAAHVIAKSIGMADDMQWFEQEQKYWKIDLVLMVRTETIGPDIGQQEHTDHDGHGWFWTVSMGPKATTEFWLQNVYEIKMPIFAWNGSQKHKGIRKQDPNFVRAFMVIRPSSLEDQNDGHPPFISWSYNHESKKMKCTQPNMLNVATARLTDNIFTSKDKKTF